MCDINISETDKLNTWVKLYGENIKENMKNLQVTASFMPSYFIIFLIFSYLVPIELKARP